MSKIKQGKIKAYNTMRNVRSAAENTYAKHAFDTNKVIDEATNGEHRGESMVDVYNKIMSDERIDHVKNKKDLSRVDMYFDTGEKDKDGNAVKVNVGWYDPLHGYGNIDQSAYDNVSRHFDEKSAKMFKDVVDEELGESDNENLTNSRELLLDCYDEEVDDHDAELY